MSDFYLKILRCCCPYFSNYFQHQGYLKQHQKQDDKLIEQPTQVQTITLPAKHVGKSTFKQQNVTVSTPNKHIQQQQHVLLKDTQIIGTDYREYISKQHPYYSLLSQKMENINNIFDIQYDGQIVKPQTPYKLQIKIGQSADKKNNIFSYTFQLPSTYQHYQSLMNDFTLQKSFDTNIDQYCTQDYVDNTTNIIYLAYKRFLIVAPRDFVYVRYTFKHDNQFWSLATSLADQKLSEGKVRGTIILTATKVVAIADGIRVNVYSQTDMKIAIKPQMARNRGVSQIKKYLDKCYNQLLRKKNQFGDQSKILSQRIL